MVYDDKIFQSYIKSFYENEIIIPLKKLNMEIPKNINDFVTVAVNFAYSDAKRVCAGIGEHKEKREKAISQISEKLKYFVKPTLSSEEDFDNYHKILCGIWCDAFKGETKLGEYGKAQKIVNMAFKYLFTYSYFNNTEILSKFDKCHFTLDSFTLKWLRELKKRENKEKRDKLKCLRAETRWSNLTELEYQTIKEYASECIASKYRDWTPLKMEFVIWSGVDLWNSLYTTRSVVSKFPNEKIRNRYRELNFDPGNLLDFIDGLVQNNNVL